MTKIKIVEGFDTVGNKEKIWLPQITADYRYVMDSMKGMGVPYTFSTEKPQELKSLHDDINPESVMYFSDKIENKEPIAPIFISQDNEILDGHNRNFAYQQNPKISKIFCIKVMLDAKDGARMLNKIQDRSDWENEKIVSDFNLNNTSGNEKPIESNIPTEITEEKSDKNKKDITAFYKNATIPQKSKNGNFYQTEKKKFWERETPLKFENLYETESTMEDLIKEWLGDETQLKESAVKSVLTYEVYCTRKLKEMAEKKGYDGIHYKKQGILQSLK